MVQLSGFDEEYSGLVSASYWNYYPVQFVTSQSINVHLRKLNGNCNLYIRPLAYPTRVSYEYFDASSSQEVDLIIQYPGSSIWYVGVYGYSDCNYTVEFSFIGLLFFFKLFILFILFILNIKFNTIYLLNYLINY